MLSSELTPVPLFWSLRWYLLHKVTWDGCSPLTWHSWPRMGTMCSHCGLCIPGSLRLVFHKMPKVGPQGGAAPGVTDSSHAFTTFSAISRRSSWSCQTLLFCLQYTLHQSQVVFQLEMRRTRHSSIPHASIIWRLKGVCLYAIDWLQSFHSSLHLCPFMVNPLTLGWAMWLTSTQKITTDLM